MKEYRLIDFHSHIIPTIDHGSTSLEISLKQVEFALNANVSHIVATPHFYPDKHDVDTFIQERNTAFAQFTEALNASGLNIDIRLGAEVLLCPGLERLPRLPEFCISGTKCILIELPFLDLDFQVEFFTTVENIIQMGYTVVLAHVDRYPYKYIDELVAIGAELQVNASALTGLIKHREIYNWIKNGYVVALGSDIHMLDKSAYRSLAKCERKLKSNFGKIMEKSYRLINDMV